LFKIMPMRWFDIKNKNYWRVNGKREFTIQEVSQVTGITVRTLRNYLKSYVDLLQPRRGYYNSLVFSEQDINVFVMIKTLIKDGFKVGEIQEKVRAELPAMQRGTESHQSSNDPSSPIEEPPNNETLPQNSTESMIRVNPRMLKSVNSYLLAQEKRNSILEHRLERIERLLERIEKPQETTFSDTLARLVESTQALWLALKKAIP